MVLASKVLITGIDSFTGGHLSKHLSSLGYDVYGTVIRGGDGITCFNCDITKVQQCKDVLSSVKPEYVIHLAGISYVGHDNTEAFYQVNTLGTQNLLDALVASNCILKKVILASSATVYGDQGREVLDESMCPQPANHYGISKLAMEHAASAFFSKLPIIIVRPFNYTGVEQPEHFLVPKIVSHFKRKESVIELGNLHVSREFNDVSLACDIYTKLLQCDTSGEIVNLCSGQAISLMEIIELMNTIAEYEINVRVNPAFMRANEIKRLVGSTIQLEQLIGKITPIALEQTLRTMYEA